MAITLAHIADSRVSHGCVRSACVRGETCVRNKLIALAVRLIKRAISLMAARRLGAARSGINTKLDCHSSPDPATLPDRLPPPDYVDSLNVAARVRPAVIPRGTTVTAENQLTFINVPSRPTARSSRDKTPETIPRDRYQRR